MTKVIDLQAKRRHLMLNRQPIDWIYGITTVPARRNTTLPRTLTSLKDAGFPDPILFVDGLTDSDDATYYNDLTTTCVVRQSPVGAYGNWALSMTELFFRNPNAQRYALFEDDILASTNIRKYLDRVPIQDNEYWNLFEHPTLYKIPTHEKEQIGFAPVAGVCLGALALVFSNPAMRRLLADPEFFDRAVFHTNGQDGVIGRCMERAKIKQLVHRPSLVQHMGRESIIGSNRWPYEETLSLSFVSRQFDCMDLLKPAT